MGIVSKIRLPDNSEVDIRDSRIPGVDTTPTSGSSNLVTSGGTFTAISDCAHKTGSETIAGNKTFTGTTQVEDVYNDSVSGFGWLIDCDSNSVQDALDDKEESSNKVTTLSASSTNTQYPSAKCVWDLIGDVETLINAL